MPRCMHRLNASLPCPAAGRPTPTASPRSPLSTPASGRPSQLDNPHWLATRYAQDGDRAIAQELGCDPRTVRAARRDHGIMSAAPGRRRGRALRVDAPANQPAPTAGTVTFTGTLGLLVERFQSEARTGGPAPTEHLLAARLRGAHDARQHGNQLAYEDALLGVASAAALVVRHQRRLRGAE